MFIFFIKGDVSLLGFKRHKAHESAPPPLTDQEKELELVKQQEVRIITVLFSTVLFSRYPEVLLFEANGRNWFMKSSINIIEYIELALVLKKGSLPYLVLDNVVFLLLSTW